MKTISIHTNHFVLHPSGGVYWKEKQTWLLADIHLGKVAHFRKNGIAVPREAEGSFYQKMEEILPLFPVKRIL
jgi:metallophosphoesterase superfamily enzyme